MCRKGKIFLKRIWKSQSIFWGLTILMLVCVLIVIRYSSYPLLIPCLRFLEGEVPSESIPRDLSISYIAAYIFYLLQVWIPQNNKEKKALLILKGDIEEILVNTVIWSNVIEHSGLNVFSQEFIPDKVCITVGNEKREEHFPVAIQTNTLADTDSIYNFLQKADEQEKALKGNIHFGDLNNYFLEQITTINLGEWFEVYRSYLIFRSDFIMPGDEMEISTRLISKARKEEVNQALEILTQWLKINIEVKK